MKPSALPPNDTEMTLVQHLLELRNTVTKTILAILVIFVVLFPFANEIYTYISEPLSRFLPDGTSMIATGVASPFLTPFKLSLVLAIYFAMPIMFYQVWRFIEPALYQHERKLIGPMLFFSSFLFFAGGAFAYYVVFPLVFGFLSGTAPEGVTIATDISLYLDFVIKMFFAFGIAFEVPIAVILLILSGMVSAEKMSHARPYVVVGAFVVGMLLTPPDIISQTLLAIPMWLLYEAGTLIGARLIKHRKPEQDTDDDTEQDFEFDDRYADQLDDDTDWDKAFDEIEDSFDRLEKEQQQRQKSDTDSEPNNQPNSDTTTPNEKPTDSNSTPKTP
ncbi:MAG: twin-arginine translocase subunit TatC [Piscirickettsiaceae bacterium CG_4_9_14_3_um_filter_43_564]|nr:twin-arginine translocase subunit TatC [Thiomicrospira sp.]OIP95716.1 MAG: twin arginine-targeting protein translocase TatC [Thiomicrospira sp. CG2_30_44_34]PIQ06040.1 MAG: twin-arginine translocase subunit TatC [Piscirickettsiaceae bacterium CG18_big_fil_WC_8_21_14_2_50_44_103]PIU38157.1 MAG: twin-arginine translocase subunit TatC [Piscirickettsiaceae bacterium CG07_land_8_20_14_0_80_44_28]PIW57704.1 MAG: twin-arginine translocase subunit TatC [Piscirickettsiaceae bacterium CG12_big_fil_rev